MIVRNLNDSASRIENEKNSWAYQSECMHLSGNAFTGAAGSLQMSKVNSVVSTIQCVTAYYIDLFLRHVGPLNLQTFPSKSVKLSCHFGRVACFLLEA